MARPRLPDELAGCLRSAGDYEETMRTGAETLVQTLLRNRIEVCFANPGTSEMHFVGALDGNPEMRCVLGLFEGVVTGAADGYYRIAERPAATLLHLAPGLGNGLANLHNARKARSGIINIVGDHATYYADRESPLAGDVEGVARAVSTWVRTTTSGEHLAHDAAEAIQLASASPGAITTLIVPADVSWGPGGDPVMALPPLKRRSVSEASVASAADVLKKGGPAAILLLGDAAVRGRALDCAGLIAETTGCRLLSEIHNARIERGAGRVDVARIPYTLPIDNALQRLAGTRDLVLAGAAPPVSFFAYPGRPTQLQPDNCAVRVLAGATDDIEGALEAVAERLGVKPGKRPRRSEPIVTAAVEGEITLDGLGAAIARALPEGAVVVDEAATSGRGFFAQCAGAAPHDWLMSRGASIGFALPTAIGAAIAAPNRKILAMTGDGSGMYTVQSLWTMARESLDVTVLVFANRAYRILEAEFRNMGLGVPSHAAKAMLHIGNPDLDWCSLARGLGVDSTRVTDLRSFAAGLERAFSTRGPYLIEVLV